MSKQLEVTGKQLEEGESALPPPQPSVFDLPKVLAVGVVSPAAAVLTARFGVAGTLLGLFLSSVFVTAGVDLLKVYLARVPGAVTSIPGGFRKKSAWRRPLQRMRLPFSKFASLPHPRRRSLIIGSIAAAGISFGMCPVKCVNGLVRFRSSSFSPPPTPAARPSPPSTPASPKTRR